MPRRNGHNRKRYVITCRRCGVQFRASRPDTKYHPSCRVMECQDRKKAELRLSSNQVKPSAPSSSTPAAPAPPPAAPPPFTPSERQVKERITLGLPNGDTIRVYPVFDHNHKHILYQGKYYYTDGTRTYAVAPEQVQAYWRKQAELRAKLQQQQQAPRQPDQPETLQAPKKGILRRLLS